MHLCKLDKMTIFLKLTLAKKYFLHYHIRKTSIANYSLDYAKIDQSILIRSAILNGPFTCLSICEETTKYKYIEYHNVCPLGGIGTPQYPSVSECPPPP
jgi:hypothetical protein